LDVSAVFLLFYSGFFAMLVSDAGYGMLFLVLTLAIRRWATRLPKEVPHLLGVLSVCTIVWGVLTGAYFGISIEALPAVMQGAAIPWLRDEANLMQLCFLIGAVHLSLAHGWALVRAGLCPAALAQLGWIAVTWVMYYLAMNMILERLMPGFVLPLFLVGVAAVALFMTPLKALKTEWPNHMMLPLTVVGNFGDVVSYVRLFAVGSAGTAISVAFNDMAVGGGIHGVGDGLVAALILFLAHGLNILLAGLAVIVHGVRLNTLEFSGHLGMQWTGVPFKPFRRAGKNEVTIARR
jgi:V/A-type H+-transporting ATPase subunit I